MIHKFHTQSDAWCMLLHVVVPAAADADAANADDAVGDDDAKVTAWMQHDVPVKQKGTTW